MKYYRHKFHVFLEGNDRCLQIYAIEDNYCYRFTYKCPKFKNQFTFLRVSRKELGTTNLYRDVPDTNNRNYEQFANYLINFKIKTLEEELREKETLVRTQIVTNKIIRRAVKKHI